MYDPQHVARYYDEYGDREWERLESTPDNRVNFHVHRFYMEQFINAGDRVLDIGCGPGRFSIELVRLGARVTAADISQKQLDLHQDKMREAGCEYGIEDRHLLDVVDLSRLKDQSFDAVVCYGGALSYVFDRFDDALRELLRVIRPDGYVLFSVMSLVGSMRGYLPGVVQLAQQVGIESVQRIYDTGDLSGGANGEHKCRMYRWSQVEALLRKHACTVEAASAANFLVLRNEDIVEEYFSEPDLWQRFLEWEIETCRQPGALDGGTHIIVVLQKRETSRDGQAE
jgi:2-polyprenyl-3-methyl-5-hydroxy-6-metoxy-1,4-benzoquinol methylase